MAHLIDQSARPNSIVAGLRGVLDGWRRELERHRTFERTFGELSSLSDRELADIGVNRSQIVDLAWSAARRD